MGKKSAGRATWWKMQHANKDLLLDLEDEELGALMKHAIRYFDKGEIIDIDNLGIADKLLRLAFIPLKQSCDEALSDYSKAVANGYKGANERWPKKESDEDEEDRPPIPPL